MVHFAIEMDGVIRPLCGDWADSQSWTRTRSAVTCPRCVARLERERSPRAEQPRSSSDE